MLLPTIKTLESAHTFHKLPANTRRKKRYHQITLLVYFNNFIGFGTELKSLRDHANFVVIKDAWEGGRRN